MAISVDPPNVSKDFSNRLGLKYQLLSDEKLSTIKDYGVADGVLGIAKPATFILDKDRIIHWKHVGADKTDTVFSDTIIEKLKSINAKAANQPAATVQRKGKFAATWGAIKKK